MSKGGWTMATNANLLAKTLIDLDKPDIIDFAVVLYRKGVLKEENIDCSKLSDVVVGLLGLTIGLSYNEMHPTEESKVEESYSDWVTKMAKITLKV